jgi:hypothetical protein
MPRRIVSASGEALEIAINSQEIDPKQEASSLSRVGVGGLIVSAPIA